jgi:spore germination cell wall hydrolase CwlJ-like protein
VIKFFSGRAASAVIGISMLAVGSSASAQGASAISYPKYDIKAAVKALDVDTSARPLGTVVSTASTLIRPAVASTTAIASSNGNVFQAQPAKSVTLQLAPPMATEAAWLYRNGWPLYALVGKYETNAPLDEQMTCLATAVYFEARGESLEGQLAVAHVVMNRATSGRYPSDWCSVIKQHAQFSFVRNGEFPAVNTDGEPWRKAQAIAELAASNVVPSLSPDVLWYHADYVAPSWGQRLNVVEKIGAHIFYRA